MTISYTNNILETKLMMDSVCVYRNLLRDPVISRFYALIDCTSKSVSAPEDVSNFLVTYIEFVNSLVSVKSDLDFSSYILKKIIFDENPFTVATGNQNKTSAVIPDILAANDLDILQKAVLLSSSDIKKAFVSNSNSVGIYEAAIYRLPDWNIEQISADEASDYRDEPSCEIFDLLSSSDNWSGCVEKLKAFHQANGSGEFARSKAFIWQRINGTGRLAPVKNPDPVRLSDLIDYESERSEVIRNTQQFLEGCPANNVLLYGDRGTGKSSTVKALLNEYYKSGLRVVEVPKNCLMDFPEIVNSLAHRNHKFILFIDDLAFEDNEENYTALKAVLEGSLETKPANVLIYATSNRRHLIKEKFSDRAGLMYSSKDDEVRAYDSIQEKLSLSDRFGITVVFSSPDKQRYLHIVEELAARNGLVMDKEKLHREAMKWELWYNGRSPRTAQQFITWLIGCENNI